MDGCVCKAGIEIPIFLVHQRFASTKAICIQSSVVMVGVMSL